MSEGVLAPEWVEEVVPPDIEHLVTEHDEPVDNIFSEKQQRLLTRTLYASWPGPGEGRPFLALANVGLFFSVREPPVVPDVLLSLDVQAPDDLWLKQHRSYFLWEYGKPPEVVVEIVSNRKGGELGEKRALYARLGIPYYIVFDPERHLGNEPLHRFELHAGSYVPMTDGWMPLVGLGITLWEGTFEAHHAVWLRWQDAAGYLLLTGTEAAQAAQQRAERLAAQLRALGIEPEA